LEKAPGIGAYYGTEDKAASYVGEMEIEDIAHFANKVFLKRAFVYQAYRPPFSMQDCENEDKGYGKKEPKK
jgi:hypothetical protein